jgi:hypothetical protein
MPIDILLLKYKRREFAEDNIFSAESLAVKTP